MAVAGFRLENEFMAIPYSTSTEFVAVPWLLWWGFRFGRFLAQAEAWAQCIKPFYTAR